MEQIEQKAIKIVKKLQDNGYDAYFAGGCVRDKLLGKRYKDIDIATSARPDDIKRLFKYTIEVGVQFGVVIVVISGSHYEVATFRRDGKYYDGRRPSKIYPSNAKEDVLRRDFTINGMLYDPIEDRLLDFVGGHKSLKGKEIKCIGDPIKRFTDDKLRLLRAIRFATLLNYEIEDKTWTGIILLSKEIKVVSKERIRDELIKLLTCENADKGVQLLAKSGLLKELIPNIYELEDKEEAIEYTIEYTIKVLKELKKESFEQVFACLLYKVYERFGKDYILNISKGLSFTNKEQQYVYNVLNYIGEIDSIKKLKISELKRLIRGEYFICALELYRALKVVMGDDLSSYKYAKFKLKEYNRKEDLYPEHIIDGKELIKLGFRPSPLFKNILYEIEDMQLSGKIKNKEEALLFIRKKFKLK